MIYVKALTEVKDGQYITLTATNPDDKMNTPISRVKNINSKYDAYTINPVFNFSAGSFSHYEANYGNGNAGTLYLGDGESYNFYLDVKEPNAKLQDVTVKFNQNTGSVDTTESNDMECDDDSKAHIYLRKDITDSNGVQYYTIGHNYDYTTMGYLTGGNVSTNGFKFTDMGWNDTGKWWWFFAHHHTSPSAYLQSTYGRHNTGAGANTNDAIKIARTYYTVLDNNYYYYDSLGPQTYLGRRWITCGGPNCDDTWVCEINFKLLESFDTYIEETVCKDSSIKNTSYASLTISYKDVNNTNSSNNIEKKVNVVVQKRNCPKSINGLWTKTTDANGTTCWKFNGSSNAELPPYIKPQTVYMNANETKSYKLNTNVSLNSSNTKIIAKDSSNSLITLSLGSNNTISITTGEQKTETISTLKKEYIGVEPVPDPDENPDAYEDLEISLDVSNIFIIEYYENNKKTTSGEITVIYN